MPTLYENYNTGDTGRNIFKAAEWGAQTFTPTIRHIITSVKLLIYRAGSPGLITVGIYATDGSGHPKELALASGTINGNTLGTDTAGAWVEITLGAGTTLDAGTKYAIVIDARSGSTNNELRWRYDGTSPTYAGGSREYSTDSGDSWVTDTTQDYMFEDWGNLPPAGFSKAIIIG